MPVLGIVASQISGHLFAPSGAYDSIATVTVGSGGSSTITFSSIPSTYKHLQIRLIGRTSRSAANSDQINIRFNSDSGANYSTNHYLEGNGSAAGAGTAGTSGTQMVVYRLTADGAPSLANAFGAYIVDILDYSDTNKYKTLRSLGAQDQNTIGGALFYVSALWMSTSAVNSITITPNVGPLFNEYSQFALYGIKGA